MAGSVGEGGWTTQLGTGGGQGKGGVRGRVWEKLEFNDVVIMLYLQPGKVYITPQRIEVGVHHHLNYKTGYLTPNLCKNHSDDPLWWFCNIGMLRWLKMLMWTS